MSPSFQTYLAVMGGGALGTGARMWLSLWMASRYGEVFPWGTFSVNVIGCFIIGLFSGLTGPDGVILTSPLTRQVVMIGFLGGFTTFSSFSLQTLALMADGEWFYAFLNIILTLVLCLLCTWAGLALANWWQAR